MIDYNLLKLKSYRHWEVYLHENQCYLGRMFVQLKDGESAEDFLDIEGEVRAEFFQIGQEMKRVLKELFQPDKMNYAALSNVSPKIHVHFIPRYKEPRKFGNVTFVDARWGQNFAPYDRSFHLEEKELLKIRDALKNRF